MPDGSPNPAVPWMLTAGPGVAVLARSSALLIDPRSLGGPDDLVDLLTAMQAGSPPETLMLVAERMSSPSFVYLRSVDGRCHVWRVGAATVAGEGVPQDPPDDWSTVGELQVIIGGAAASEWYPASSTIEVAGGIGIGLDPQRGWWTSGGGSPQHRERQGHVRRSVPMVEGVRCARGHLNNPASLTCMFDGLSLATATQRLTTGPRPVFASLFADDGEVIPLDVSVLLGREPGPHEWVRSGEYRDVALGDPSATMSRAHAAVRLVGWDAYLMDVDSRHGTYHRPQPALEWERLGPHSSVRLRPGAEIRLGSRTLRFERHDGVG